MQLSPGERSLIASFQTEEGALKAKESLEELNPIALQVDRFSIYPDRRMENSENDEFENPITGSFPGLANSVYETTMDRDSSVAASANPSASGMSDGNPFEIGDDVLLTAVLEEEYVDKACQIIEECGGVL